MDTLPAAFRGGLVGLEGKAAYPHSSPTLPKGPVGMFLQDRCCLGVLPQRVQMWPGLLYVRQEPVCICKIASCLHALSTTLSSGCPANSRLHPSSHADTCRAAHLPLTTRTMSPEPWNMVGLKLKVLSCLQHPPSTWAAALQHLVPSPGSPRCQPAVTARCSQVFGRGKRGKLLLALQFHCWGFHRCEQFRTFESPSLGDSSLLQLPS